MARLEDLRPGTSIRGVLPGGLVTVVGVEWFGSGAIELTYKDATGKVGNELLYRDREADLEIVEAGRPWSFDGDGSLFRLVSEAQRIRLAHLFDPVLAVHTSRFIRSRGGLGMATVKRMACLANSRKINGRCIAGKEFDQNESGAWIRPVGAREYGEVSEYERQYEDGSDPQVLDIIDVPLLDPRPKDFQQENWLLDPHYYWAKSDARRGLI
jgi:hypothetical protein